LATRSALGYVTLLPSATEEEVACRVWLLMSSKGSLTGTTSRGREVEGVMDKEVMRG